MLPSIISRCLPVVRRAESLRSPILKLVSVAPSSSRFASNIAKHSAEIASEEKVDATVLVSKDLAKMFEEIHLELESEIRYDIELKEMAKYTVYSLMLKEINWLYFEKADNSS